MTPKPAEERNFFLKEKVLELWKGNAFIVSILRDLIGRDRPEWAREKKEKHGKE